MIRHLKRLRRLNSAGDTIVEVLIVLAVLGLALSISYATANKGLQKSRNAEEHSQALGLLDSQVELLRSAFAKDAQGSLPAAPFCLAPPASGAGANPTKLGTGPSGFQDNRAADNLNTTAYPGPCTQDGMYSVSIVNRGSGIFDFRVRWDGLGDLGRQQEELTYRIDNIVGGILGYTDPETPAPVTINCPDGSTVTPPAVCPPVTINCPGGVTVIPPAVCPPPIFTWNANGGQFTTCINAPSSPIQGDNQDGCDPSASPPISGGGVFARRPVNITYKFATSGTLTGIIPRGAAKLTINFNQYAGSATIPPDNYSFQIRVKIGGTDVGTYNLTPDSGTRRNNGPGQKKVDKSWDPKDATFTLNIPVDAPSSIELDWLNNTSGGTGRDHRTIDTDLQINTIRLSNAP